MRKPSEMLQRNLFNITVIVVYVLLCNVRNIIIIGGGGGVTSININLTFLYF